MQNNPTTPTAPKTNKKWLLWGLIGFTGILVVTAVVLFFQLRQPTPSVAPRPSLAPKLPAVQETTTGDVCELSFSVKGLKCEEVTLEPTGAGVGANDTRKLTAKVSGGSGTYTHAWTITTNKTNKGSLSSATTNPTTWTAPSTLDEPQEWTIKDTITDNSTTAQSATCEVKLNFGGLNACFDTCAADSDCEADLRCQSVSGTKRCVNPTCPEDADCICASASPSPSPTVSPSVSPSPRASASVSPSPSASAQAKLPEAGFNGPMVMGVSAGILMMLAGLLWL
jgi:hypothetical protein